MAVWSSPQDTSAYGNINMRVWVGRGACSRTATSVSFSFGVCFRPLESWTSNSIAAWYGGVQKFAFANPGKSGVSNTSYRALKDTDYYAQFSDRNTLQKGTSEVLCYSYSNTSIDKDTDSVEISVGVGWNNWSGSEQGTMTFSIPIDTFPVSNGTAPNLEIIDNGDNTATIKGKLGESGTNNGLTGSTLYWTTNGLQPSGGTWYTPSESMGSVSGGDYSKTIDIPSTCSGIWAVIYCAFEYNTTNTPHLYGSVKYYTAPGNPGKPVITYTKSRLTIKEPWTISWDAAQAGNSNSPIAGYRLRIYKNGLPIDIKDSSGTVLSTTVGADKYYDVSGTSYVIDPSSHDILPSDNISIALFAYAVNGAGTKLWSGNGESEVMSDLYTVQNAGVMRPLYNGEHVEGVVWACIPDDTTTSKIKWVEADIVKVRTTNNTWVEAE